MIKRNPKEIEASRIWREKDPEWIAKHPDTWKMAEGAYRQALLWEVISGEADGEAVRVILDSMMSSLEWAKYVMQESRGEIGRGGFGPMYIEEAKAIIQNYKDHPPPQTVMRLINGEQVTEVYKVKAGWYVRNPFGTIIGDIGAGPFLSFDKACEVAEQVSENHAKHDGEEIPPLPIARI